MAYGRRGAGFLDEAFRYVVLVHILGVQHLDDHLAIQGHVHGAIDFGQFTAAFLFLQQEVAERQRDVQLR